MSEKPSKFVFISIPTIVGKIKKAEFMRVKKIILKDYIPFKDSAINSVEINFTAPIQITIGSNGSGKAQPYYSRIKTPDGWKYMMDMKVGTVVSTPDGGTAKVTSVHPQGLKDIYRVTFVDGRSTDCCGEHLWKIYNVFWKPDETKWRILNLNQVINWKMNNPSNKAGLFIPLVEPEIKDDINLPLDPYILGVILGDGNIQDSVTVRKPDKFIKDEVTRLLPEYAKTSKFDSNNNLFRIINAVRSRKSKFRKIISDLGLDGTFSYTKFIPDIYMKGSAKQKLNLLQGLMDTDGTVGKPSIGRSGVAKEDGSGSIQFCTTSEIMARQVQELIWSLGGICKIYRKNSFYTYKGERKNGRPAFVLNIRFKNGKDLFRTPIKKNKIGTNQHSDRLRLRIASIEYIGKKVAQCISIDHPDQLYITDDYIVTHNSSFLRQLSSSPPVRSLFGKNGYKSIVIEKDGEDYILDTDFSKSTSPHLFFKNDDTENLNPGRTTDIQKDLIIEHLGITPLVDDLIMNRFQFPKWTPSKRKEFIMSVNPDKIGFIQKHLKDVSSKIRSAKNNLSRLQSRKILLENEFLSEENLNLLLEEKKTIENDLNDLQKSLMLIDIDLKNIGDLNTNHDYNYSDNAKTVRFERYALSNLSHIDRDDKSRDKTLQNIQFSIQSQNQKITFWEDMIREMLLDIEQMEIRYREICPTENSQNIEETISRLEEEKKKIETDSPLFEISEEELSIRYEELENIQKRLEIFSKCEIPLYSRQKRNRRKIVFNKIKYQIDSWNMTLSDLRTRYQSVESRNTMSPKDIPDSPCAKNKCPLFTHFMSEYEHMESQRIDLQKKIIKIQNRLRRAEIVYYGLSDYFKQSEIYHETIYWLVSQAQGNPILHHTLRSMDILTVLKTNPNRILMNLKDSYDSVRNWLRFKSLENDLNLAYELKRKYSSTEGEEILSLTAGIELQKNKLNDLRLKIKISSAEKQKLETELGYIEKFNQIKSNVENIAEQYNSIISKLSLQYRKETLLLAHKTISQIRSEKFMRMSELEKIIRYQETLKARYDEEIISEIEVLEKDLNELEYIEKALIAIPRESTIAFLNSLFEQANRIIEMVWTLPLQIEILTLEDPLNYEFYVSGDNTSLRELSECSEGQTEIISLAINLSLRIVLGYLEIPLTLDEVGRTFDEKHKERLIDLLRSLIEDKIISQLFIVSHHALIHEGFSDQETFVIREDNILLPPDDEYNKHVIMT